MPTERKRTIEKQVKSQGVKHYAKFTGNIQAVSFLEDSEVIASSTSREGKRRFQTNVFSVQDVDEKFRINFIDSQKISGYVPTTKYIIIDMLDNNLIRIREYDNNDNEIATMVVEITKLNKIKKFDFDIPKPEVTLNQKDLAEKFETFVNKDHSNKQIIEEFQLSGLRELGKANGLKRPAKIKNESQWLVKELRKKLKANDLEGVKKK